MKKEDKQVKTGKTRAGSQKYKCKHCGKVYMPKPKGREQRKKQNLRNNSSQ